MDRRGRLVAAAGAVALQLAVLYAPRAPSVSGVELPVDKVVHAAVFLLPTVALVRAGVPRRWVLAGMALHAPISELIQHELLGERSGELLDIAANLTGVALGAYLTRPAGPRGPGLADPLRAEH